MPTVLRIHGYRFFFFSLEGKEPAHIHVEQGSRVAKYWLKPIALASSSGFRSHGLTKIRSIVVGAPSKASKFQLVKIQLMQRWVAGIKRNAAWQMVTDALKPAWRTTQAVTQVKVLSSEICYIHRG